MLLKDEIEKGESRRLEFKGKFSSQHHGIAKTAISFSNGAGGKIIIGIKDKTRGIIGLPEDDLLDLPDTISNIIYDQCYPNIIPEIFIENLKGKNILVIEIFPGNLKPYYLKSKGKLKGTYIRIGATNRLADEEMILELERQRRNISFDEEILYDYDVNKLDFEKLKVDIYKYTGKNINKHDLLTLKLAREEHNNIYPTRAGILLAGRGDLFEYARIKCAMFKGTDMNEFIDQKEFGGYLYTQVEGAMNFAKTYIAKSGIIKELQRKDQYEVPLIAIRESLVNAVVHRDYSISGSDTKFAIFDDRIEITSPGLLPKSLDISDIVAGRSEIRNKIIARFFKEIGFIEQWGTGIRKIISSCENYGLKTPKFIETGLFFKVVIFRKKKSGDKIAISGDKVAVNNIRSNINPSENIINYLKKKRLITNQIAREITGLSSSGVRRIFSNLAKNHLISSHGKAKGRYYTLL